METKDLLTAYLTEAQSDLTQAEDLERQARDLRCHRDGLLQAINLLRPLVQEDPEDLTELVVDFTGCSNTLERLIRISQIAPHKVLNTTRVTQYLLDHGQSQASFKNYRTEINWTFNRRPTLFQKVRAGTYRYAGDVEAVSEVVQGPVAAPVVSGILEGPNVGRYGPVEG